jgi:hypothetical protein
MLIAMSGWFPLLAVIATLVALALLERWIHQHLHGLAFLATGDADAALLLYALLLLPGVMLHELSHWVMAKLLGVKTAGVSLWPHRQRDGHIRLGAVTVQQTDAVRASLIGAAPLISGSLVALLIGQSVFGVGALGDALRGGNSSDIAAALAATLRAPDMWVWLYLLFAIANAMLPSASDRETWPPVILFLVLVAGLAYILGLSSLLLELEPLVMAGLRWLAVIFGMTLVADVPFVILIASAEWMLGTLRGKRVYYKRVDKRKVGK